MIDNTELKSYFPISGDKIKLRLFQIDDITKKYVGWLNDIEVVKYSNQRFKQHTIQTCKDYFKLFVGSTNIFLAIIHSDGDNMIGTMTTYININHKSADIGILIGDRNYWGKGIGRDSWKIQLDLLLENTELRKVTGGTLACNIGMLKIMKEAGMQEDGCRKKQELVEDKEEDILYFAKYR